MLAMSHKLSEQTSEAAVLRKKLEESQSERASREKSLDQELKLTKQKLDVANQQIQALSSQLMTLEGLEQKARSRIANTKRTPQTLAMQPRHGSSTQFCKGHGQASTRRVAAAQLRACRHACQARVNAQDQQRVASDSRRARLVGG
ncbi:hypothetical protein BCR44DRAFT_1284404 [Catenaria anguillulae PL171]|uniref:Uncharacterized protein n=1 Tax=Catenaria anguillulae PL171 TaxID=765915 RepID=A0A1Y2HWG1_9FUNG|nr:hypothetical protein BCR44DRAFT_1284404 [Catenaria anguillulae PL171]